MVAGPMTISRRRRPSELAILCAGLSLLSGRGPLSGQAMGVAAPAVQESSLENGIRILVLEDHSQPRVACKILTRFGAVVEEPGRLGSAHYLEHLMFKGTDTIGTTDWPDERPVIERIAALEADLLEERDRARRELRQRGVFLDYQAQATTPRIEELQAAIRAADEEDARFVKTNESMSYYQRSGGTRISASTEQEYMKFDVNLPSNRLEMFFRIEADRMANSQWRQFDAERMILWEQRLGDLGRPDTEFRGNAGVGERRHFAHLLE